MLGVLGNAGFFWGGAPGGWPLIGIRCGEPAAAGGSVAGRVHHLLQGKTDQPWMIKVLGNMQVQLLHWSSTNCSSGNMCRHEAHEPGIFAWKELSGFEKRYYPRYFSISNTFYFRHTILKIYTGEISNEHAGTTNKMCACHEANGLDLYSFSPLILVSGHL